MRRSLTPAEKRMAGLLDRLLPERGQVERQWAFGSGTKRYILDFYLPEAGLGLEVDGEHHKEPKQRAIDSAKESEARATKITIRRISNHTCLTSSDTELTDWLRQAWKDAAAQ